MTEHGDGFVQPAAGDRLDARHGRDAKLYRIVDASCAPYEFCYSRFGF